MGLELAAAAFWLFLAVVVASLIWRKALQRREVLITLRTAIDKGLPLDDKRLQALLAHELAATAVSVTISSSCSA